MALKEINSLRTKTMKVFQKSPGIRVSRCHCGVIHYPDTSKVWRDIDNTLISKAGGWYTDKNACKSEIPSLANGVFSWFNQDHFFDLSLVGVSGISCKPIDDLAGNPGKAVRYENIFGDGIHFDIYMTHLGMIKRVIFEKPPPDIKQDFIIDYEILSMPDTIRVESLVQPGTFIPVDPNLSVSAGAKLVGRTINIYPSTGGINKSYINKVCCMDAGLGPVSECIKPVSILFYKANGKNYLRKIIPKEIFQRGLYPIWADDPATYNTGVGDGFIQNTSYATWDTNHDATTGGVWDGNYDFDCANWRSVPNWSFMRSGIPVDTSGIPDGNTVTAVDLWVYGTSEDGADLEVCVVGESSGGINNPMQGEDFNDIGDAIDSPTEFATRKNITAWNSAGWNTFAYNANGIASIDKTGITWACLRLGADCDDIIPGGNQSQRVKIENSEANGNDAYLDVTHAAAGGGNDFLAAIIKNRNFDQLRRM